VDLRLDPFGLSVASSDGAEQNTPERMSREVWTVFK
jgi:hypothetical protein